MENTLSFPVSPLYCLPSLGETHFTTSADVSELELGNAARMNLHSATAEGFSLKEDVIGCSKQEADFACLHLP